MKVWIYNKQKKKEEFVEVNFWSLVKVNFLTSLMLALISWGAIFFLGTIILMFKI